MVGHRTLLVNPPLVGGVAFTRQGRCQEREEVLGTTKPPYTLVLCAALLRERGIDVRVADLTAEALSTAQLIEQLERERFAPSLIVFCSTTPTLAADTAAMATLKTHFGAPLVCFGPHASTVPAEAMAHATDVDGMFVGEPEDGIVALATLDSWATVETIPSLTYRTPEGVVAHKAHGSFEGFATMPYPAWDLIDVDRYTLPLEGESYLLVETSRGCPYSCDFCVAPIHQGHKFRERSASLLVDEIERGQRDFGVNHFYLWGDTVTLNAKSFGAFCDEILARGLQIRWFGNARADNLVDPAFVAKLKRSGCWMLAMGIESESEDIRKDMVKRLEQAKIRIAMKNLREAGIFSFAFFILGYPGETSESLDRTIRYALDLDPDFANFYPAVPYPGTALYEKCKREGLLKSEEWSRMEYSYYLIEGNGLDERTVMRAIDRAKRRFFLRPSYVRRHFGDILKLAATKQHVVWEVAARTLFGRRSPEPSRPAVEESTPA
ncbi:MAG: radical SAM protein [Vicinamibacterales bacterium]